MPIPSIEQRRESRVTLKVEIGMRSATNFYTGIAMNISSGGLFVATHVPPRLGDRIPLEFVLPGDPRRPVVVTGQVCWSRPNRPDLPAVVPGMGLRFLDLSEQDACRINEFIRTIREPYFHPEEE